MKVKIKVSESEIQKQILSYLKLKRVLAMRINTKGEFRKTGPGTGVLLKNENRGFADILCIHKGIPIFLEIKTEKGKQSEEQKDFANKVTLEGAYYFIIRSIEDLRVAFGAVGVSI